MATYRYEQTDPGGDTLKVRMEDMTDEDPAVAIFTAGGGNTGMVGLTREQLLGLYHMIGDFLISMPQTEERHHDIH